MIENYKCKFKSRGKFIFVPFIGLRQARRCTVRTLCVGVRALIESGNRFERDTVFG